MIKDMLGYRRESLERLEVARKKKETVGGVFDRPETADMMKGDAKEGYSARLLVPTVFSL